MDFRWFFYVWHQFRAQAHARSGSLRAGTFLSMVVGMIMRAATVSWKYWTDIWSGNGIRHSAWHCFYNGGPHGWIMINRGFSRGHIYSLRHL